MENRDAEFVKLSTENQTLQTQYKQLSESWNLLKQIHKDLELQVQSCSCKEEGDEMKSKSQELQQKANRKDTYKQKIPEPNRYRPTKGKNDGMCIKVLSKKEGESDDEWRERDLNVGTVDDASEKKPIQFMMVVEEVVKNRGKKNAGGNTADTTDEKVKKQAVCWYYLNGRCTFGDKCRNLHKDTGQPQKERGDRRKELESNKREQENNRPSWKWQEKYEKENRRPHYEDSSRRRNDRENTNRRNLKNTLHK